jgi:hypothetical protein
MLAAGAKRLAAGLFVTVVAEEESDQLRGSWSTSRAQAG